MASKKTNKESVIEVEVKTTKKPKSTKKEVEVEVKVKTPREGSLADLIINGAKNKYPYRNDKGMTMIDAKTRKKLSDEEYEKLSLHRSICQELVRLSEANNNFPFTPLVYFAVGTDAHKKPIFDRGYKSINLEKATTILKWLDEFAKWNKNPKYQTSDKIVHAFAKLYDTYSKKDKDFRSLMRQFTKQPASEGYKPSQWKNMQSFYELFTKPLITKIEVNEETKEETIVDVKVNPLAKGKKTKKASCSAVK